MINWAYIFWGNTIIRWLEALATGVVVFVVLGLLKWLLRRRAGPVTDVPMKNTSVLVNKILDHTPWIFILWIAVFAVLRL